MIQGTPFIKRTEATKFNLCYLQDEREKKTNQEQDGNLGENIVHGERCDSKRI